MKNIHREGFDPDHRVTFGKHRGKKYRDVPLDYLKWFASNAYGQMVNRRRWAIEEIKRRESAGEC